MKILAFETSCDDTAVAVVEDGVRVLSSVRQSQVQHTDFGGVVPELAARLHSDAWPRVLTQALAESGCTIDQIDALAVTQGPGLQTSLLVGTTAASTLSIALQKPVVPVHHIYGHITSVFLGRDITNAPLPALVLTISGGHTQMHVLETLHKTTLVGTTIDDAIGEAFDKVAKMLGLGYPGGPVVSALAKHGDPHAFELPIPMPQKTELNFSLSGLKAAVRRLVDEAKNPADEAFLQNVCASFQYTVVQIVLRRLRAALQQHPAVKSVCLVGGVSANVALREALEQECTAVGLPFFTPTEFEYCTDNAAMIAGAAYWVQKNNPELLKIQYIDPAPRLKLPTQ